MDKLADFFIRLAEFHSVRWTEQRRVLEQGLQHISSQLPRLHQAAKAYEAKASPRFNVYRILRLERKEVLVHTPMLAQLLDPAGTHGQGFLFLNSFLLLLDKRGCKIPATTPEQSKWHVEIEKPTGSHGNLDVLITCVQLGIQLVIENKVGALEREDQIWDYWCWLQQRKKRFPCQCLVFLTPDGRSAKTAKHAKYTSLSYHTDIFPWLSETLPHVESPTVHATIRQYLQIIENC